MQRTASTALTPSETKASVSAPSLTADFWPAQSLDAWQHTPADTFLSWLSERRVVWSRQFRETSVDTYAAIFSAWIKALDAHGLNLLEATPADATRFFTEHQLEAISRRRYLLLLDKVYRHLRQIGWEQPHPLLHLLKLERHLEVPLPEGLTDQEQTALVRVLRQLEGWKGARDRAVAALLLGAGLRTNELIALPLQEVIDNERVNVKPQGVHRPHETLVLPDGPWRSWLRAWQVERIRLAIPGEFVCPATLKGAAYTPSGLYRRIAGWFDAAKIEPERQGAGILRNTFARTALTCERYSLEQVQGFLGHQQSRATARHLAVETEDLDL